MSTRVLAVVVAFVGWFAPPVPPAPNPACIAPAPWHCDPPPAR